MNGPKTLLDLILNLDIGQVNLVLAVGMAILSVSSFIKQAGNIWRAKSAESLAPMQFVFLAWLFATAADYGFANKLTVLGWVNVALGLTQVLIIISLAQAHAINKPTALLMAGLTATSIAVGLAPLPVKTAAFTVTNLIAVCSSALLPHAIWRERSRGVVSLYMVSTQITSCTCWSIYGFLKSDLLLGFAAAANGAVFAVTLALWLAFPAKPNRFCLET